ncbi:MAG: DUF6240 domain-containing protein [Lachnospiraceae bacterium]
MYIQQIQSNTEQIKEIKTPVVSTAETSKTGNTGFFAPAAPATDGEQTMGSLSQKAKSITESQTTNHAEYVAGVMNDSLVEKAQEEGVDLSEEDEENLVTVVDKIQMELIEGGNTQVAQIADLSLEELSSMSPTAISAYEMACKLVTPTREEICYLAGNELEPSIGNFYQAKSVIAGMEETNQGHKLQIGEDLKDQIIRRMEELSIEVTPSALERAVTMVENGVDLTRKNYDYVVQLEQVQLPASEQEILQSMKDAMTLGRTATAGMLLPGFSWQERAITADKIVDTAITEDVESLIKQDKEITIANLAIEIVQRTEKNSETEPLLQTDPVTENPTAEKGISETKETYRLVSARRTLEQVRLYMSAQANLSLLKQGIHIETEPLENLVEELKKQEEALGKILYGSGTSVDGAMSRQQFTDTTQALQEMKEAPAYVLGYLSMENSLFEVRQTIAETAENKEQKISYEKANGAYETMMTQVRPDLGDSINKAFRNVDDILDDLDLEVNASNQRAVRILAYNQTEITAENVLGMKQKDEQVQTLFHAMTPKVVLSMIREGYNPLDHSLEDVLSKAEEIRNTLDDKDTQRYSRFLVQLEQQGEISEQEKDSFIGIYRLLRQVEKSDGAAVGAVILSGEKLTLRNLMTQVRTMKSGGIDLTAGDQTGEKAEDFVADLSITQQVEAAYESACVENTLYEITPGKLLEAKEKAVGGEDLLNLTPEQLLEAVRQAEEKEEADYEQKMMKQSQEQIRQAYTEISHNRDLEELFRQLDIPKSAENILAVADLMKNRNKLYKSLFERHSGHAELLQEVAEEKQKIWENFSEAVKTPEEMAEAQKALADTAEQVMEGMIEQENISSLDIRQMQMESRQLNILSELGKKEEYAIPVLVADEMGCVSLKIVRGKEEKGKVCITTQTETLGKLAAEFSMAGNGLKGYIVTDSPDSSRQLEQTEERLCSELVKELSEAGVELPGKPSMAYVSGRELSLEQFYRGSGTGENTGSPVQTKALYTIARVFLKSLSGLGNRKEVS